MRYLRTIYHIILWEYSTRLKTRSFLFLTILLPLIVIILFLFPVELKKTPPPDLVKLIGLINLNEVKLVEHIQHHINQHYLLESGSPGYIVMPVSLDESVQFVAMNKKYEVLKARKDSTNRAYDKIIRIRAEYYKLPSGREKEKLLERSYEDLLKARDLKSRIETEYFARREVLDTLHTRESKRIADSLLHKDVIDAYLIIPEDFDQHSKLKYFSLNPDDLSEARKIQKIFSEVIVKLKLLEAGMDERIIDDWLKPIRLEKIPIPEGRLKKDVQFQFNTIMISVTFLLLSVLTAGGFLLSSVFKEKNENTIEFVLSKATYRQIMTGKVTAFCILGLTQVMIWTIVTGTLLHLKLFPLVSIIFSNPATYLYFTLIFLAGYGFYAALYIILGTHVASENEIQRINTVASFLIFLMVLMLALIPDELQLKIITYLLFFPVLSPFLVIIVLIKGGIQILSGLYLQGLVHLLVIMVMLYLADRSFKNILFRAKGR